MRLISLIKVSVLPEFIEGLSMRNPGNTGPNLTGRRKGRGVPRTWPHNCKRVSPFHPGRHSRSNR